MKAKTFPKHYRDALAVWKALRMVGFSSDDIYLGYMPVNGVPDMLFVQLNAEGLEFVCVVSKVPGQTQEQVRAAWEEICDHGQTYPEFVNACFRDHLLGSSSEYFTSFVAAIIAKGITPPEIEASMIQKLAAGSA